jgi:hypothetical protein
LFRGFIEAAKAYRCTHPRSHTGPERETDAAEEATA